MKMSGGTGGRHPGSDGHIHSRCLVVQEVDILVAMVIYIAGVWWYRR